MNEAGWPNTSLDVPHPATASADKVSGNTLYDASLGGGWEGAIIHIVPGQSWFGQIGKVTSSSSGKLTLSYSRMSAKESFTAGDPYYLVGKFKALDAPTEWFRDGDGTLYLWDKSSDNPAGHTVEAKHRDYAFDLRGHPRLGQRQRHQGQYDLQRRPRRHQDRLVQRHESDVQRHPRRDAPDHRRRGHLHLRDQRQRQRDRLQPGLQRKVRRVGRGRH